MRRLALVTAGLALLVALLLRGAEPPETSAPRPARDDSALEAFPAPRAVPAALDVPRPGSATTPADQRSEARSASVLTISGAVWSAETQTPIPGAVVEVRALSAGTPDDATWLLLDEVPPTRARMVTAADGTFELTVAPARSLHVVATAEGCAPGESWIDAVGTFVLLTLSPGSPCEVRVEDEMGRPLDGVELLRYGGAALQGPPITRHVTGAGGRVTVLLGRDDGVLVRKAGYADRRTDSGSLAEDPRIVLGPEYRLAGIVVDRQGRPVPRASVHLERGFTSHPVVWTDARGAFVIPGLSGDDGDRGVWGVDVRAEGFIERREQVAIGDERIHIVLGRAGVVAGTVVGFDGTPMAGVPVTAGGESALTDPEGGFEISGVEAGRVAVETTVYADGPPRAARAHAGPPGGGRAGGARPGCPPPRRAARAEARGAPLRAPRRCARSGRPPLRGGARGVGRWHGSLA